MIAANLAIAFLVPFSSIAEQFAFDPFQPSLLSALTCLFLHDPESILHLLGNLVFLAAVGPLVEGAAGPVRFAIVYLLGGLIGVAAHWVVAVSSGVGVPLIGASSAIAGCVGYCCIRFARRRVPVAPRIEAMVGWIAVVWVVLQAVGAFVRFGSPGGTAFVAHIGGFLGGIALAFVFRAQVTANTEVARERLAKGADRSPAASLEAAEEFLKRHPGDTEALWNKAAALHSMGEYDAEAHVLATLAKSPPDLVRALDCLVVIDRLRVIPPKDRTRAAVSLEPKLRRDVLMSVVDEPTGEPERPYALLALSETADDEERKILLGELERNYEFHPATELARSKGLIG